MICDEVCTANFLMVMKISTSVLAIVATFMVIRLGKKHTDHYSNPLFQKKIIVIIYIIPFYSVNAMLSNILVKDEEWSETFSIFRGLYEAIVVIAFFQMIVAFLCWKDKVGLIGNLS